MPRMLRKASNPVGPSSASDSRVGVVCRQAIGPEFELGEIDARRLEQQLVARWLESSRAQSDERMMARRLQCGLPKVGPAGCTASCGDHLVARERLGECESSHQHHRARAREDKWEQLGTVPAQPSYEHDGRDDRQQRERK